MGKKAAGKLHYFGPWADRTLKRYRKACDLLADDGLDAGRGADRLAVYLGASAGVKRIFSISFTGAPSLSMYPETWVMASMTREYCRS